MRIVDPAGFCDRQVPVLSTIGRGPKGEKGDTGDSVYPTFADDPWSIDTAYDKLTVVTHEGNSYTAKQNVPAGINITNTDFWIETGNYNEQIERYREDVIELTNKVYYPLGEVTFAASMIWWASHAYCFIPLSSIYEEQTYSITSITIQGIGVYTDFSVISTLQNGLVIDITNHNDTSLVGRGCLVNISFT